MMRAKQFLFCTVSFFILGSCSWSPQLTRWVSVNVGAPPELKTQFSSSKYKTPVRTTATQVVTWPANAQSVECVFVNVTGYGVPTSLQSSSVTDVPWDCLGFGTYSKMVAATNFFQNNSGRITMTVPSGPARFFQVFGVSTGEGESACDGKDIQTLLESSTNPPLLFELGNQAVTQLYADGADITINNSFDPTSTLESVSSCLFSSQVFGASAKAWTFGGQDLTGFLGAADSVAPPDTSDSSGTLSSLDNSAGHYGMQSGSADPAWWSAISFFPDPSSLSTVPIKSYLNTIKPTMVVPVVPRFDFLFDLSTVTLSQYRQVLFQLEGGAGTSAYNAGTSTCASPLHAAGNLDVRIWDPESASWVALTPSVSGIQYTFILDEQVANGGKSISHYAHDYTTNSVTSSVLHLSVRGTLGTISGTLCSSMKIESAKILFSRVNL